MQHGFILQQWQSDAPVTGQCLFDHRLDLRMACDIFCYDAVVAGKDTRRWWCEEPLPFLSMDGVCNIMLMYYLCNAKFPPLE